MMWGKQWGKSGVRSTRRPEKALTAQFVRTAKEPGKYFDGHGLFLRVDPNGSRYWVQRIVIRGKRCELGLGSPSLVSLVEAREAALANRKMAREGGDPLHERRKSQAVLTFEEAARRAHEELAPTWKNPKDRAAFLSSLESYMFPSIGRVMIPDVTSAQIRQAILSARKVAPEVSRKLVFRTGAVFKWAIAEGMRSDNPSRSEKLALPRLEVQKGRRKSLPYDEINAFLEALAASRAGISTKLAMELVILTAARSGEVREARWDEIDLDRAEWIIPPERMKMKREHRIPLPRRAVDLLTEAKGLDDGSGLVFPGTRQGRPLSDMTLSKLVKELGFDADVHGFRTSFRTWAQERTNFPREVAEAALAHQTGNAVEQAYARSDLFEKRRKIMAAWATYLANRPGKVVRIG